MSDDTKKETGEKSANEGSTDDANRDQQEQPSKQDGPTFTPGPDPLGGVKKGATSLLESMEGRTVSMKVYVGTIIGVVLLMLLARCGG